VKILVADDSKTNLAIITATLHKLGHEVISASNSEQAIEIFKKNKPDLIILDVMMEGIDGFECAKRIRALDVDDWIPIIFLSASVDDTNIARGIDAGGDDYLTKPCSEITLAAKIKAMQRIADMRQQLFETTEKLYLLSSTDSLTGTYNRLQFDRSIKEIIATANHNQYMVALLFIDLDNFKNINDTYGHHIGDVLLVEVAKRLKSAIRSSDFIARLGGDEFAIILTQIANEEEAKFFAQKILDALSINYNLEGHNLRSGASIGIAYYPASVNQEGLVLDADVAMYHAKACGRNNFQCFSKELNEKYRQQISLEHALKFALERKELFLTYQPIFDLTKKELVGLETLVCWDHPKFGLVSPNIFIPIAEDAGLINDIGTWILQTACAQAAKLPLNKYKNFKFAINLSSRQLIHENFFTLLTGILTANRLNPQTIELELTETTVMTYTTGPFKEAITRLHNYGINIAIDDFGTGYSSLIRLKHLPVDTLKIETSFVQDSVVNPNSKIIVNCLIALGKNLGMNVIAEGIETKEQLDSLIANGCPQGQGFYLEKPMVAEKLTKFFEKWKDQQTKLNV
jgi:diguanylate cyclase (GGDEF)-like protein